MTKQDLVALAEALRLHNRAADGPTDFTPDHLRVLADFCASQDPNFNREWWIDYVVGEFDEGSPRSRLVSFDKDKVEALKLR
jgi:hypothetical protein